MSSSRNRSLWSNIRGRYSRLSLKGKLSVAISLVSLTIVLLSMLSVLAMELSFFRNRLTSEYGATARMIATNLEAALEFEDQRDSKEILDMLRQREHVVAAGVYLADGRLLSVYLRDRTGVVPRDLRFEAETSLEGSRLLVNQRVEREGAELGRVLLLVEMEELSQFLWQHAWSFLGLLGAAAVASVWLAARLAGALSRPIRELAATAQRIRQDHDFSTRQKRRADDETGRLVDAFNEMMSFIEQRDEVIREKEERFRGYFELGIVGTAILDANYVCTQANRKLLDMLDCDWSWLEGRSLLDLFETKNLKLVWKNMIATGDYWLSRGDGSALYVRMSMRRVPASDPSKEHIIFLAQDITDRKLYEEEILKAKELAESSSKAKDDFLSVISHELRTPLNPILGYVEMLLAEPGIAGNPESAKRLQLISKSAEHLLGLINDVLDYSRIERGVVTLSADWVDYGESCRNVVNLLRQNVGSSSVELRYAPQEDARTLSEDLLIQIDRIKLQQVLFNLVANSSKFTRQGFVEIRTWLKKGPKQKRLLRIEVEDTGIGIDPSRKEFVFKPFAQLDDGLNRNYGGLGLGLAICQKVVLAMDGIIDFWSEPGSGTCFWLEIPVDVAPRSEIGHPPLESAALPRRGNERILLVEDDLVNRELARSLLASFGHEVICAKDGEEAVEAANRERFDLIIMDVRMPRMNGFQAAKKIRSLQNGNEHVPIVAVTADVNSKDEVHYLEAGMDDYLAKPFSIAKMNAVLDKWLGGSNAELR